MCPYFIIWIYNEQNCIIQFADDTVVFVSAKDVDRTEFMLNEDLKNVSSYFVENELVINLKAGKIEYKLVGTSRKLSTVPNLLILFNNHSQIYVADSYKYFGTIVNLWLNLKLQFDKAYKQNRSFKTK